MTKGIAFSGTENCINGKKPLLSYKITVFYFEVFTLKYFTPSYGLFERKMLHHILQQI